MKRWKHKTPGNPPGVFCIPWVQGLATGLVLGCLGLGSGCRPQWTEADLTILNGAEPETLDPALMTGQPDGRAANALFEGLTRLHYAKAVAEPGLAESWDITEEGRVYTFHLREGIRWSTGEPITAEHFRWSWIRAIRPETASDYAAQLYFVKNAEAFHQGQLQDENEVGLTVLDDRTFRVELENPTPFFLDLCAFRTLWPVPPWHVEAHGDRWLLTPPVPTSGAYTLDSWRLNDRIRVRKNPLYWDAENVRSKVVDFLSVAHPSTAFNIYETGKADIIWDSNLIPNQLHEEIRKRPDGHVYTYLGTYFIRFNVLEPPFNDVRVRKALTMSLDRQRIVDRISKGGEKPAFTFTPPGTAGYVPPEGLPYDPDEARRLMAEAGYPEGKGFPGFKYLFNATKIHEQVAVELQDMWKQELGITMEVDQKEWKVYLAEQSALQFQASRSAWVGDYNDPNTFLDMFMTGGGNNRTGWSSERYDELIRQANATLDSAKRLLLFQEAEKILITEGVAICPIYFYVGLNLFDPEHVRGIEQNLIDEHPVRAIWKE